MSTETNNNQKGITPKKSFSIIEMFEKMGQWAEDNAVALVIGFTGVVVACILAVGISIYRESAARKHFAEAYTIEQQFENLTTGQEEDMNNPEAPTPALPPSFTAQTAEELQPKVLSYVKAHPKSDAARNLAIKWVSKLYDIGQYDKATAVMNEIIPSSSSLSGLAMLLKGSTLIQAGQAGEAITVFQQILKQKNWEYIHPEASYQMSIAQLKNNDPDAAIVSLKNIQDSYSKTKDENEFANRDANVQATKVIRWLQYQKAQKQ